MPFNAGGSSLQVKGVTHLTHGGFVMLGKRLCARLESRVETSKLDVPEEVPGKFDDSLSGDAVSFFDVRERRFVRVVFAERMAMSAEMTGPKLDGDAKSSETARMSMKVNARITLSISE